MSNNIAEGSGSNSKREFANFLNIARRSTFENANAILVLEKRGLIEEREVSEILSVSIIYAARLRNSKGA